MTQKPYKSPENYLKVLYKRYHPISPDFRKGVTAMRNGQMTPNINQQQIGLSFHLDGISCVKRLLKRLLPVFHLLLKSSELNPNARYLELGRCRPRSQHLPKPKYIF